MADRRLTEGGEIGTGTGRPPIASGKSPKSPAIVPYPEIPLEEVYVRHRLWRPLASKHTRDLLIIMLGVLCATYFVAREIWGNPSLTAPVFWGSQILAAMFTSFLATFAAIYQLSKMRLATVDVFSSEILARLRILAADNIVVKIASTAGHHRAKPTGERTKKGDEPLPIAYGPSSENHFETFFRHSSDLGALASVVVDHVTDFYCFQMAARDEMRDLTQAAETDPDDIEEIRSLILDTIFMLDLMAYSGLRALDELIELPSHRYHSRQVALCVATRANGFLLENMASTDHRYAEVLHRRLKYDRLVGQLKAAIKPRLFGRNLIPRGKEYF